MTSRVGGNVNGLSSGHDRSVIGIPKRVDAFGETITDRWWSRF